MKNTLTHFTAYINGTSYIGEVNGLTPPKIAEKIHEHTPAGIFGTVVIQTGRFEKMEMQIKLHGVNFDALKNFSTESTITIRGALKDYNGTINKIVIEASGIIKTTDLGEWNAEGSAETTLEVDGITFLKIEKSGTEIAYIDIITGDIRFSGGTTNNIFEQIVQAIAN